MLLDRLPACEDCGSTDRVRRRHDGTPEERELCSGCTETDAAERERMVALGFDDPTAEEVE